MRVQIKTILIFTLITTLATFGVAKYHNYHDDDDEKFGILTFILSIDYKL